MIRPLNHTRRNPFDGYEFWFDLHFHLLEFVLKIPRVVDADLGDPSRKMAADVGALGEELFSFEDFSSK
jgi:hypothetical protein